MSSTRGRIGAAAPMLSRAGRSLSGSGHRRQCILSRIVPLLTTGPTRRGTPEKIKKLIQESKCRRNTLECFRKFETKFKKNGLGRKEETVFETIVDHIETILKPYCNIVKHCPRVRMHSTKCPLPIRWSSRSPSSAAVATIAGLFGKRQWLVRSVFLCNACCPVL